MQIDEHHFVLEKELGQLACPEAGGKEIGRRNSLLYEDRHGPRAEPVHMLLQRQAGDGHIPSLRQLKQPVVNAHVVPAGEFCDILAPHKSELVNQFENGDTVARLAVR